MTAMITRHDRMKSTTLSFFFFLFFTLLYHSESLSLQKSRRNYLQSAASAAFVGLCSTPLVTHASPYCAAGVGENCKDLSEGNAFIQALQQKSAESKDANLKASTLAYQLKNYPDFFASLSPPKYMVMKRDGTFVIFTDDELTTLKQAGKIKVEHPMAFHGKIMDLTQKPVMVLVE